jgi:glycosyltransferase involved in cell wall biosynthesis
MHPGKKIKLLFFIGSLTAGGKERRLIELLSYLKKMGGYELMVAVTDDEVHYPAFYDLAVAYKVLPKKYDRNYDAFLQFYKLAGEFKPDIIHTWGRMQTLYSLPTVIIKRFPLVNSQITAAPPNRKKISGNSIIDWVNFGISTVILSNSKAGIEVFRPPLKKSAVIYNGLNRKRFLDLPAKEVVLKKYSIETPFLITMAASFTANKNYDLFIEVAKAVLTKRKDVTFIGVGRYDSKNEFERIKDKAKGNPNIIFPGMINDVEALVNASTMGVLFSNSKVHGEGISNAILEYMALGKPVVANDAGGTREVVLSDRNGYLISEQSSSEVAEMIIALLNDTEKCREFGEFSKKLIEENFTIDKMGDSFIDIYKNVLPVSV